VRRRYPAATERLVDEVTTAVQQLRQADLLKPPGVAETLDWTDALLALGATKLDEDIATRTLGAVLKYREDHERVEQTLGGLAGMLAGAAGAG
jgi:MoxR-like ATPase